MSVHVALSLSFLYTQEGHLMRLLIIEDDEDFAFALATGLRKQGYAIDTALDGERGYDLAQAHEYDLLILDRNLPGLAGLDICRLLREEQPALLVLMLTASGEVQQRVEGLDVGADDYITKPFAWEELLARIRALLRRNIQSRAAILRCGDLSLDTTAGTICLGSQRLRLTAKEYGILEYLLRNQGKLVTNQDLLEHAWDNTTNEFTNTIRVHITSLRRKLGDNADQPRYIETVQGKGYRMVSPCPHHEE